MAKKKTSFYHAVCIIKQTRPRHTPGDVHDPTRKAATSGVQRLEGGSPKTNTSRVLIKRILTKRSLPRQTQKKAFRDQHLIFFWGVDGRFRSEARSGHLSLTHGPAGNRTTTGNLSGISTSSTLCCNSLQQQHLNDCNQHSAQLHIVS